MEHPFSVIKYALTFKIRALNMMFYARYNFVFTILITTQNIILQIRYKYSQAISTKYGFEN